jgi:hypothetical protein
MCAAGENSRNPCETEVDFPDNCLDREDKIIADDTPKHPQIGFEQGKQALGAIFMHLAAGVLLLRMIDVLV